MEMPVFIHRYGDLDTKVGRYHGTSSALPKFGAVAGGYCATLVTFRRTVPNGQCGDRLQLHINYSRLHLHDVQALS